MDEDLFVLLVPGVHPVPVDGHGALDLGDLLEGRLVAPDRVLRAPFAHDDVPIGGLALEGTEGPVVAGLEQIQAQVRAREVVDRHVAGLAQQPHLGRVGQGLAAEDGSHTFGTGLEIDTPAGVLVEGGAAPGDGL